MKFHQSGGTWDYLAKLGQTQTASGVTRGRGICPEHQHQWGAKMDPGQCWARGAYLSCKHRGVLSPFRRKRSRGRCATKEGHQDLTEAQIDTRRGHATAVKDKELGELVGLGLLMVKSG